MRQGRVWEPRGARVACLWFRAASERGNGGGSHSHVLTQQLVGAPADSWGNTPCISFGSQPLEDGQAKNQGLLTPSHVPRGTMGLSTGSALYTSLPFPAYIQSLALCSHTAPAPQKCSV